MSATLIFLPADAGPLRWWRLADGQVAEGTGAPPPVADDRLVAVPPADAVTLHWAAVPARTPAQATAAARILVAEASAAPIAELHVAVGDEGTDDRPIGVVAAGAMRAWLDRLASEGIDPDAMVPAPLLVPPPSDGFARAEVSAGGVVRGTASGFADEARLTALIVGDAPLATVGRTELNQAFAAAVVAPALDLRQGLFARKRRAGLDWVLIRRLGWLAAVILLVTLATGLVQLARYSFAADALTVQADRLAATGLPRGETVTDADRQLRERLGAVRGPGLGFTGMAAGVFGAVRAVPGTEVTGLDFQPTGDLKLTVAAARESLPTDLKRAIERAGFRVDATTFASVNGRVTGEMTVHAP